MILNLNKITHIYKYKSIGETMRIIEEIVGKEVLDSSAIVIGKVKDVDVDFETKSLDSFILGKGGISEGLGLSKGETIVPYDMVKKIGDKILLKELMNEDIIEEDE
jgi:sporulation protein YlmC with PRC-barrel domain